MKRAISKAFDRADAQVKDLRSQLDHQDRLVTLGLNSALVVHEFRNLLTPLRAYAQLALQHPGDSDLTRRALQQAAAYGEQASEIAESLLRFIRPSHGEAQVADVRSAIDRAMACIVRPLESDGIRTQIGDCSGARAAITPIALQHVLLNLITNARAAMAGRGGELTIETLRSTGNIRILVRDTGKGMSADEAREAMTPFFTSGGHPERSGLGMAVCHRLVSDVGGTLAVQSAPGDGTCITITLPEAGTQSQQSVAA